MDFVITTELGYQCRLTSVYGHLEEKKKCQTWDLIRQLGEENVLSWFCVGDFNRILNFNEKKSGNANK